LAKHLQRQLTKANCRVDICFDGKSGLAKLIKEDYDLVVLDLLLPQMLGTELLEKLRRHPDSRVANTRVVVCTNYPSDAHLRKCQQLGVDDFFIKADFKLGEITERILSKVTSEQFL